MLNLSSNINVISEDNPKFHTGQRYKTTADRHILLPTSFDPADIHDFFDNKLSGPYTIISAEHTKKEDSGSTTQVNGLLFSKSLSLIDGDDNIHSVSFNSDEDKQNWKRMIMERVQELPGLTVNPDRDLLRNDVTVFLPTEEIPKLEDGEYNVICYYWHQKIY